MMQSRRMARERAQNGWTRKLQRAALGGFLSLAVVAVLAPDAARAQEEEKSGVWDSITGMVRGLRLGTPDQDIDYRERSPLVVPPSRALPAPQAPGTGKAANWPVDPDLKKKQEAAERRKRGEGRFDYDTFIANETPAQLNAPGRSAAKPATPGNGRDIEAAVPPSELGSPGFFGLFKSSPPTPKVFTAEKPRKSLTDPPPGYQTPSVEQPYAAPGPTIAKPTKPADIPVGDIGL